MKTFILDTDIGTDVDDAMTLIQLLGQGMGNQMTITTCYGDTALRARIASRYCRLSNSKIEIYAGETETFSGKEIWLSGLEGSLHQELDKEVFENDGAVQHLIAQAEKAGGELVILAIGPLTNIAKACLVDIGFASKVKHLYVMGGRFAEGRVEHNFSSDAVAADIVFRAGFNATVVGLEATMRIKMPSELIERIGAAGDAGNALASDIYQWWEFWKETWNVPHDPIAALTFLKPELFDFSEWGTISVETLGLRTGVSSFKSGNGSHRIVTGFNPEVVAEEIVQAIEAQHKKSEAKFPS